MAPAKKAPALFAQLQRSLEKDGKVLGDKVKVHLQQPLHAYMS
jgi:hypothetical protein